MRAPGFAVIALVLIGATLAVLVAVSGRERAAAPAVAVSAVPEAASVAGGGVTLTSTSVELPDDAAVFPDGPNVALVNQRCVACHSASMVLTQPKMKREQWQAIVEKMRDTYHAPMAEGEVAPIVGYLAGR
ncbi:cytochrome c [Sphingomonas sp. CCH5-D11]|uniref:cytochrome c n=1 Tax=Sphingomonas sp. CCH5-D11 TaxID=1768786 RepID=UPI000B003BCC|nr:cytochrome c [Sphingomonas sp. CCH5-D11]